ncbi:MAG: ATP-dependent Clp protease ATP-binding subunit ClpC [bacterium ADurb.Bin212]|nr:MAG: ATP-dependent Clp protease ATP-binding subunit ClpC [bacterium ADurb.Bin212]
MADYKYKIDPRGTIIAKAVAFDAMFGNFLFAAIAFIIWLVGLGSIVVVLANMADFVELEKSYYLLVNLATAAFLYYLAVRRFYLSKIKHPKPISLTEALEKAESGQEINLYSIFSFELAKSWNHYLRNLSGKSEDAGKLTLSLLESKDLDFIMARLGYSKKSIEPYLKSANQELSLNDVVARSLKIAVSESHRQIECGDLFIALCESYLPLKSFISDIHIEIADLANIVYWQTMVIRRNIDQKNRAFDPDNLHLSGGIGRDWIYGFAPLLKQYARDMTESIAKYGLDLDIVGHDKEIKEMEESLTRQRGGNVILVGEAGVGKKTTVMGFAKKVENGTAMGTLRNKHLLQIDLDALLAGAGSGGEITQRLTSILNEAVAAGNIILFIENIQNIFSSGDAGKVNAVEVLLPYLETSDLYIIGTCDIASYSRYISTNSALIERFTKINIEEPSLDEMVRILEDVVPSIEYHTNSLITYGAIKQTIKAADKYIMNLPNPEKSINLLDGASAKATSERKQTIIVASDIDEYVSEKYDVPTSAVGEEEKNKLLHLEEIMHQRVIGQAQAINAIANALRRTRAGVTETKKPIGSFLFLGSTGVGKTETAKALAEAYFGDQDRMIRFDMSEYQNKQDIYRFIGASMDGEETPGQLTTAIREHPFSLLLFDELEKANPDILNLFLQILDEGHLTDGSGRKVSFTNSIIIATSNAGANVIKQSIGSGIEYESLKKSLMDYIIDSNIYRPEFINRFTGVIVFSPLSKPEIEQIATLMLKSLAQTLYQNKGVDLSVTPDTVKYLAEIGFDPQMGARPMARTIQEKVEDMLAKKLLGGELNKGDSITISAQDLK